ncbi:hypothetical protein CDV31_009640 [Fusarium ambrosium]|uniref:Protein kinase domain-containing protein n=1 Tax=Fusarium ambrosium TaxID=131363 RepID=A0A428TTQ4_9HYPO|nr:hypothetical protein CDV31_009640 [Fusarium ambrosium]
MAEVLGFIASVCALAHAAKGVGEGIGQVIEMYKAPEEIKSLREQLLLFQSVLQITDMAIEGQPDDVLCCMVSRARCIMDDLSHVISTKLLRNGSGSNRARRRAWMRHKAKILRLKDKLVEVRENILVALSSSILCHRIANLPIHGANPNDTMVPLENLQAGQRMDNTQATSSLLLSSYEESLAVESTSNLDVHLKPTVRSSPVPSEGPSSAFEMMPSFRPAAYTARQPSPKLLCYDAFQVETSDYQRVNYCTLFYSPAPNQWIRLTIFITTTIESQYWNLWKVKNQAIHPARHFCDVFPAPLAVALSSELDTCGNLQQDSEMAAHLGSKSDALSLKLTTQAASGVKNHLRQITRTVYHLGCPRYFEKDLNREHLACGFFITFMKPRWMLEFRFRSDIVLIETDLYDLEVLYSCQNCPGVSPFGGVILDNDGPDSMITGFLTELPTKGRLSDVIYRATTSGQQVSWERRLKWCRQLVQATASVHKNGKVIGSLGKSTSNGIGVDGNDDVVLFRFFEKTFLCDSARIASVPPEYHEVIDGPPIAALPETDLYQLGLRLWCIAAHVYNGGTGEFCRIAGCSTDPGTICTESHAHPTQLPAPSDDTPQYLKDVIKICRSEDPNTRKAAHELLAMFPTLVESGTSTIAPKRPEMRDSSSDGPEYFIHPESCWETFGLRVNCSYCGKRTTEHYYQCDGCNPTDYHLCPDCFSQGAHCADLEHYLREFRFRDFERVQEERYYSSVNATCGRDIIEL